MFCELCCTRVIKICSSPLSFIIVVLPITIDVDYGGGSSSSRCLLLHTICGYFLLLQFCCTISLIKTIRHALPFCLLLLPGHNINEDRIIGRVNDTRSHEEEDKVVSSSDRSPSVQFWLCLLVQIWFFSYFQHFII